ncbi:MAG TPA: ROK family protein [Candidatus Limnocylindrales bacterium]
MTVAAMLGGVEGGGTKFVCVIGTGPDAILRTTRIEVTDPATTLAAAVRFFRDAVAGGISLAAIGVASFGPVELRRGHPRYGFITNTPKPGWSRTDMIGPFTAAFGVPVGFDMDVNAAALAEGRWGAARGLGSFVYLTVGTGIGGGAVIDGRLLPGLGHPEMGHVMVPRRPGDAFAGVCPFHGDCLEGMASGPAVATRFGRRAEELDGTEREAAVALVAWYLAAGVSSIVYALAPERIVVGGGLGSMPGLVPATRAALADRLGGYPGLPEHADHHFVVPAGLGGMAGPLGSLVIAERAAAEGGRL